MKVHNANSETCSGDYYDVLTLGEPLIRFTPEHGQRLEQASHWYSYVGGSELNTAVGLARLGLRVGFLTRLTNNSLGKQIRNALTQNGVDTSFIRWTDEDRVGIYYMDQGTPPRASQVVYDRKGSASSKMQSQDLDVSWFSSGCGRLLHLTGISLAVSELLAQTATYAAELAKKAGWRLSFDVNFRAKLWSYEDAARRCEPLLAIADVIFVPQRDAIELWHLSGMSMAELLHELHRRYPGAMCVVTMGSMGAQAIDPSGNIWTQSAFATTPVDPIGGGDAFSAGFLYKYLDEAENDVGTMLRWGAASAALKKTLVGDIPLIYLEEVAKLVTTPSMQNIQR